MVSSRMVDSKDNRTKMVRMDSNKVVKAATNRISKVKEDKVVLKVVSKTLTVSKVKVAVAHRAVNRMDKTKTDKVKADRTTLTAT